MPYKILYNFWLICCNIIGRLFCKRKGGHDLAKSGHDLAGPFFFLARRGFRHAGIDDM